MQATKNIIPEDWKQKPFSECIEKTSIPREIKIPQNQYQKTGKYPIVDQGSDFIAGFTDEKSKLYSGQLPVIVFGDHTRIFKYVDFSFSLGADGTKLLCPRNFLDSKYFYFYLLQLPLESKGYNRHYKYLKEKNIIFPEKTEQQKITFVLSKLKQAITQQEQIIDKTKELKRSLMHRLFTYGLRGEVLKETEIGLMPKSWTVKRIEDIVEKAGQKDMSKAHGVQFKYIDVSSISNDSFKIIGSITCEGFNAPSRARKIVRANDVLFATVRPMLKRIAYVGNEFDGEICSTAFCVLRSTSILSSRYLYHCVQRDSFIESLGKLQRGANYPAVTDGNVKDQLIPFPMIKEQKDIANVLGDVDNKIDQETIKKDMLNELFKSMLQLLMTGRIRIKDIDFGEINV